MILDPTSQPSASRTIHGDNSSPQFSLGMGMAKFSALPADIINILLTLLPIADMGRAVCTCKRWAQLSGPAFQEAAPRHFPVRGLHHVTLLEQPLTGSAAYRALAMFNNLRTDLSQVYADREIFPMYDQLVVATRLGETKVEFRKLLKEISTPECQIGLVGTLDLTMPHCKYVVIEINGKTDSKKFLNIIEKTDRILNALPVGRENCNGQYVGTTFYAPDVLEVICPNEEQLHLFRIFNAAQRIGRLFETVVEHEEGKVVRLQVPNNTSIRQAYEAVSTYGKTEQGKGIKASLLQGLLALEQGPAECPLLPKRKAPPGLIPKDTFNQYKKLKPQ